MSCILPVTWASVAKDIVNDNMDTGKFTKLSSMQGSRDDKQSRFTLASSVAANDSIHTERLSERLSFYKTHGKFEFSNYFDEEDIEWIINSSFPDGKTLLHTAVLEQREDMMDDLLKLGGNLATLYY